MLNLLIAIIGDTYEIIKAAEIEVQINKYFNNIIGKLFSIHLKMDLNFRSKFFFQMLIFKKSSNKKISVKHL